MQTEELQKMCCGCSACQYSCPVHAIEMVQNEKGFYVPQVQEELCIHCGKCKEVCQMKNFDSEMFHDLPKAYGMKLKDTNERLKSRSGGLFYALAAKVIDAGGIVYGAKMEADFTVHHAMADNRESLEALRGVKYVQSDLGNAYSAIKQALTEGKTVLFSGTSCQVAGLYQFLGKLSQSRQLYTMDLICHGVPSPFVWRDMLTYYQEKWPGEMTQVSFRDKSLGWDTCKQGIVVDGQLHHDERFTKLFMKHLILNEPCHSCRFSRINRVADITMGDFWGIDKVFPEFHDNKGVSLALINTSKGKELFEQIEKEELVFACEKLEDCMQRPLKMPSKPNHYYNAFWKCYLKKGLINAYDKYTNETWLRKMYKFLKKKAGRY